MLQGGDIAELGRHSDLIGRPGGAYSTLLKLQMTAARQEEQAKGGMEGDESAAHAPDPDQTPAVAVPADDSVGPGCQKFAGDCICYRLHTSLLPPGGYTGHLHTVQLPMIWLDSSIARHTLMAGKHMAAMNGQEGLSTTAGLLALELQLFGGWQLGE